MFKYFLSTFFLIEVLFPMRPIQYTHTNTHFQGDLCYDNHKRLCHGTYRFKNEPFIHYGQFINGLKASSELRVKDNKNQALEIEYQVDENLTRNILYYEKPVGFIPQKDFNNVKYQGYIKRLTIFKNGAKSEVKNFYFGGTLKSHHHYKQIQTSKSGKKPHFIEEEFYVSYDENGQKTQSGSYLEGLKHGTTKIYDKKSNKVIQELTYEMDKLVKEYHFYPHSSKLVVYQEEDRLSFESMNDSLNLVSIECPKNASIFKHDYKHLLEEYCFDNSAEVGTKFMLYHHDGMLKEKQEITQTGIRTTTIYNQTSGKVQQILTSNGDYKRFNENGVLMSEQVGSEVSSYYDNGKKKTYLKYGDPISIEQTYYHDGTLMHEVKFEKLKDAHLEVSQEFYVNGQLKHLSQRKVFNRVHSHFIGDVKSFTQHGILYHHEKYTDEGKRIFRKLYHRTSGNAKEFRFYNHTLNSYEQEIYDKEGQGIIVTKHRMEEE